MSAPLPVGLTDEQRLLAETLDRFASEQVAPRADAIERDGLPRELVQEAFGEQLLQLAALPEELGGAGGDLTMALLVPERLGAASAALASVAASAIACTAAVVAAGSEAVARVADGALLVWADGVGGAGAADSAPGAAPDGGDRLVATAAEGGRALDGRLASVAGALAADALLVLCEDEDGLLACCVDAGASGVTLAPAEPRTGLRGDGAAAVELRGVRVADGVTATGAAAVGAGHAQLRLGWAAVALGVGREALRLAVDHLQERRQFGRPLGAFRGLRDRTGAHAAELDAAGALLYEVARRPDALRAAGAGAVARATLVATETAVRVATDAIQLHGGYGYTDEYRVSRLLRDAVSLRAAAGGVRTLRAASAPPALHALAGAR